MAGHSLQTLIVSSPIEKAWPSTQPLRIVLGASSTPEVLHTVERDDSSPRRLPGDSR